jgi:hypothetical protein
MGVVKGAADYVGLEHSPAWVYGASGHAFLINVHDRICPSGPYCWKYDGFYPLVRNLGLEMTELGFFHSGSGQAERRAVELKLIAALDQGLPASVLNLENQLVCGYDEKGLLLAQPWGQSCGPTPAGLTFGTWPEFGDEVHVSFFTFRRVEPAPATAAIRDSLRYALDLFRNPDRYQLDRHAVGLAAYDNWTRAAAEHGADHGNWWNAVVWSECRKMAAAYFTEIAGKYPALAAAARELSAAYQELAELLGQIADKQLPTRAKTGRIRDARVREKAALALLASFTGRFEPEVTG